MLTRTRCGKRKNYFFKLTTWLVLTTFSTLQITWAQGPVSPEPEILEPVIAEEPVEAPTESPDPEVPEVETSLDFLSNNSVIASTSSESLPRDDYSSYSFDRALDNLRPDYAAAIPLASPLSREEWQALRNHAQKEDIEIAVIVTPGEKQAQTDLITIGSGDEIMVSPAGREFIETWGRFVMHFHPGEHSRPGPTGPDLAAVPVGETHYLMTPTSIYAYSREGTVEVLTLESFLERYGEAIRLTSQENVDDRVVTEALNQFIAEQDRLNREKDLAQTWLAGGTLSHTPSLASSNVTNFSGSPWLLLLAGSSAPTTVVQPSASQFRINYDVTQAGSKSGAVVSFDNPTTTGVEVKDVSSVTDFVVGLKGPSGSHVQLEVEDSLGNKDTVTLLNLASTATQYYKIPKTLFTGIDWTKLKTMTYRIDNTLTSTLTGTLTIGTKTLTYSTTLLTNLPNSPYLVLTPGSSTNTNLVEVSSSWFRVNYDVAQAGSISGGSMVLDNPATATVETANLSTKTEFTFALYGPTGSKVKLEFQDNLGNKSSVLLTGLTAAAQYYTVLKDRFTGLDWTKIKQVNFIVDSTLVPQTTGQFSVWAKTLTYSTTLLTNLPASPKLEIEQDSSAGTVLRQYGMTTFALDFSLPASGDKSGAMINFDNAAATAVETQNLSSFTQFVFSASATASVNKMKVTLTDSSGAEASVVLTGITTSTQYFVLPAGLFTIDRTKVKSITFSIDKTLTNLTTGSLYLGAKTLLYSTTLATNLISKPNPVILEGSSAGTFLAEPSGTQMKLNLDVTAAGSYSGMSFRFDNPATAAQETQDLSAGDKLVFGFQAGSTAVTKVRLEVKDKNGNVASNVLPINTGTTYITIQKSLLTGIDWTNLTSINFIVDRSYVTSNAAYKSYVHVTANNFLYTPTVIPSTTLTSANISTLAGSPSLFLLPGSSVPTTVMEATNQFTLSYDLSAAETFSGARINYDKPSTSPIETVNLSTTSNLVFGVSSSANTVRMTMVDNTGKKASVLLTNVAATEKYFQVKLSSFTGIDKTRITEIRFEEEPIIATNASKTGTLTVSFKGLTPPSLSAPSLDPVTALTDQTQVILSGSKGRGTGIVLNDVLVVRPDDATTWQAAVELPLEGENILNVRETSEAGVLGPETQVTIILDALPPVLGLGSQDTTDQESYDLVILSDEESQPTQTWRLGRGTHRFLAEATSVTGHKSWTRLAVTRTGELPAITEPPAIPEGERLTQTLTDGMVATYVNGELVLVKTQDGTQLVAPVLNETSEVASGWFLTPDGTTTYMEGGVVVWTLDAQGTITWYFSDGRQEAIQSPNGDTTSFAYRLDADGNITAVLVSSSQASILLDPNGQILKEIREDGRRLIFSEGRLESVEAPGEPALPYIETIQADGTITRGRSSSVSSELPLRFLYGADSSIREITEADGTILRFQEGLPVEAIAPDGTVTTLTAEQAQGRLSGFTATRSGIVRSYNASGELTKLTLSDQTVLTVTGETLQAVRLPDGTTVTNGVFDEENRLVSGLVHLADGREVTYSGGQPTEATLPDGTKISYTNGSPAQLTLSNGLVYTLEPEWIATLVGTPPASDSLIRLVYSAEWVLSEATRSDGAVLSYQEGRLITLTQSNGTVITYTYDEAGRLAKTETSNPTNPSEPILRTEYAYDRIRRVLRITDPAVAPEVLLEYTYEFSAEGGSASGGDASGDEITVVRELATGITKRYQAGLLISQTDADGAVTVYEYTTNPQGYEDPLDAAVGATRTLEGGVTVHYEPVGTGAFRRWEPVRTILPNGQELNDVKQTGNHLSDNNSVTAATGISGNAAQFTNPTNTGNKEYLSADDNVDLSMGDTDFAIAAWVYADENSFGEDPGMRGIVAKGTANVAEGAEYFLYAQRVGGTWRFRFQVGNNLDRTTVVANTFGEPSAGGWYFLYAYHDSVNDEIGISVNNGPVDTAGRTGGSYDSDKPFVIGRELDQNVNFWNGRIDEVGVWKGRVLTDQERADLYNQGQGNTLSKNSFSFDLDSPGTLTQDLVAYYDMEESEGTRKDATDLSVLVDRIRHEIPLPEDRAALRRMVDAGDLQLTPPDTLDRTIQSAIGASQTLVDGTVAHYERTTDPAQPWRVAEFTRPDGTKLPSGQQDDQLTDHNGVGSVSGKVGLAASFTRANRTHLSAPASPDSDMVNSDFSFSLWVYLNSKSEEQVLLTKGLPTTEGHEYILMYDVSTDRFRLNMGDGEGSARIYAHSLGSPSANTWYFISGWYNASARRLSLQINDGPVEGTFLPGGVQSTPVGFRLGDWNDYSTVSSPLDGLIDEVGLWKRLLTSQERADLYNGSRGNTFRQDRYAFDVDSAGTLANGLVTYYAMEESSGTRADSAHPSSALLAQAALPTRRTPLRWMVEQGTLALTQSDDLDRQIESAVGAVYTLPDGTRAHYERTTDPVHPWKLSGFTAPGKVGHAAQFTASNSEFVSAPDTADLSMGQGDFAIAAWVQADSFQPGDTALIGKGTRDKAEYLLRIDDGGGPKTFQFLAFDGSGNGANVRSTSFGELSTGTWYFVVAWYDAAAGTLNISVKGGVVDSRAYAPFSGHDGPGELAMGAYPEVHTNWFDGRLDEVGIWKKVLTAQERADLYNEGRANPFRQNLHAFDVDTAGSLADKLAAYFNLDEPLGERAGLSTLFARAQFPTTRTALRRMVELGTVQLIRPEENSSRAPLRMVRATVSYQGKTRESFTYRYQGGLTHVRDQNDMTRTYDSTNRLVGIEEPNGTRYNVSYSRELSQAQLDRLAEIDPSSAEARAILQNPEGEEVTIHRLLRLVLRDGTFLTSNFPPDTIVEQEFDSEGQLLTRTDAHGQVTLYEDGRPTRIMNAEGRLVTTFTYDETGRLVKITLLEAREKLAEQIEAARLQVTRQRAQALEDLAIRRGHAIEELQRQVNDARGTLQGQLDALGGNLASLEATRVHGRSGRRAKSRALDQIRGGMNQVRDALANLDQQYAQALGNLETQVESVRQDIERESANAFADIETSRVEFIKGILRSEIHPIVMKTYRNIIGRDPSEAELTEEVDALYAIYGGDPNATLDLTALDQKILSLPDYAARAEEVAAIKQQVSDWLTSFIQATAEEQLQLAASLGLTVSERVILSGSDVERILAWLNSRPLHFGHSAFLVLKEYLAAQGIVVDSITLAKQAVLIDILVGVITPKTNDDLEISLFTLKRLAQLYGGSATPANVSFDDLKILLASANGELAPPVIAHINGNHYILVESIDADGTVHYREPNKGAAGESLVMSQTEFMNQWQGVVLSARGPPQSYQILTDREAQAITGSFFPLIFAIIHWLVTMLVTAITFVVNAVLAVLSQLAAVLTNIFSGLGSLFSFAPVQGFGSLFQGFGALLSGQFAAGFALIGKGLLFTIGLKSLTFAGLAQFALTTAVTFGVSRGLEALGVNPIVTSLVSAFVTGGITGGFGAASAGFTHAVWQGIVTGIQAVAIQGVQIGLVKAGLDPALAGIAGIGVGAIVGSLTSGVTLPDGKIVKGLEGLQYALKTSIPKTLAGELAFYGVQKLGEAIGLDPRISQIAGSVIRSGLNPGIDPRTGQARTIGQAIQNGLISGALSVGIQFATQGLDPLLGSLASSAIFGAIDGLISPNILVDPVTKKPILDPVTGKPKLEDRNHDGVIDQHDAKGVFAGISESLLRAIGGFTQMGVIDPRDPVGSAQRLQQLLNFSDIVREQGLAVALDTYATSLLHQSSIESILNAGSSIRQYGTIREAIDVALTPVEGDTRPRIVIEEVEFEGRRVGQILFGDGGYILFDLTTHDLIAIQEGNQLIRLTDSVKVDSQTQTAAIVDAVIEQTYRSLDGATVTARVLEEISAGGVLSVKIEGPEGEKFSITPNSFRHLRLNSDGSIRDGIFTNDETGTVVRFVNGEAIPVRASFNALTGKPSTSQDNPDELVTVEYEETPQQSGVEQHSLTTRIHFGVAALAFIQQSLPLSLGEFFPGRPTREAQQAVHNWVNGWGMKTDGHLAQERSKVVENTLQFGQTGDVLLVGGDDPMGKFIRNNTGGPVNHTAYLERAEDGTLWVVDVNPRLGPDLRRTAFDDWVRPYKFIKIVRQNDVEAGKEAVQYLKINYGFESATNTFRSGPHYNWFGAAFGGLPLFKWWTKIHPDQKFCSELVCDTQEVIGKPLPFSHSDWRTPNDLFRAIPEWGRDLLELSSGE